MSHYHAARRHPDQPLGRELHAEQMSIRDYVVRHSARCWFNNGQTRLIGGTWSDPEASADQGALTRAKQNLSRFAVAGTSERFDASLALIRRRLGWVGRDYKRRNLASRQVKAEALDQRTRAEIAHRNSLDMELHAWVSQRLQRELIEERVAA